MEKIKNFKVESVKDVSGGACGYIPAGTLMVHGRVGRGYARLYYVDSKKNPGIKPGDVVDLVINDNEGDVRPYLGGIRG